MNVKCPYCDKSLDLSSTTTEAHIVEHIRVMREAAREGEDEQLDLNGDAPWRREDFSKNR